MNYKISIITAHFNMVELIKKNIKSVISQGDYIYEHIIVDDFSPEKDYEDLLNIISANKKIKIYRNQKNKGPIETINFGAKKASGDFLIFLSADDMLPDDLAKKISEGLKITKSNPGLIVGNLKIKYGSNNLNYKVNIHPFLEPTYIKAEKVFGLSILKDSLHGGAAVSRELFFKYGMYQNELKWFSDTILHGEIALDRGVLYLPCISLIFNKSEQSYGSRSKKYGEEQIKVLNALFNRIDNSPSNIKQELIKHGKLGKVPNIIKFLFKNKNLHIINIKFIINWFFYNSFRKIRKYYANAFTKITN